MDSYMSPVNPDTTNTASRNRRRTKSSLRIVDLQSLSAVARTVWYYATTGQYAFVSAHNRSGRQTGNPFGATLLARRC